MKIANLIGTDCESGLAMEWNRIEWTDYDYSSCGYGSGYECGGQ